MYEGFAEFAPQKINVGIIEPPDREYAVCIGDSILASLAIFQEMVITKDEFEESSSRFVHRLCII